MIFSGLRVSKFASGLLSVWTFGSSFVPKRSRFFCSNALERMQRRIDRYPAWKDRRRWLQIIVGGIAYLHCWKIMHNDLKSNRILLAFGPYRSAEITDFGL